MQREDILARLSTAALLVVLVLVGVVIAASDQDSSDEANSEVGVPLGWKLLLEGASNG